MSDAEATAFNLVALLTQVRLERGLSQEILAERSGLSRQGIGHMESGRTRPTLISLLRIAEVLEVDLPQLLTEAQKRPPKSNAHRNKGKKTQENTSS